MSKLVKCLSDKEWIKKGQTCLFIDEIENLEEHGVYSFNGDVHYGYHMEDFEEYREAIE